MKTSKNGINLIKEFEGLRFEAYKCPAGIPTIGYGHTAGVKMGQKITLGQAEELLKQDLIKFETGVTSCLNVPVNQNQFDALISFTYNLGVGSLRTSTLLKLINQKKYKEAANEFSRWVYAGGKILPGLVRRREAEKELFMKN